MGDALRTIHVVSNDDSVLAAARTALEGDAWFEGWQAVPLASQDDVVQSPPAPGDVLVVDTWARGRNVYEFLRQLAGRTKCRTFLLVENANDLAEPIARFCGATGVLRRPLTPTQLRAALEENGGPRPALPSEARGTAGGEDFVLPEALLRHIATGEEDSSLVQALVDPATGLFNYAFLNYKLDEEFKRARRFEAPLACVMLGFESQASDETLRELSGLFLAASRDTDVLGRFDENSFLFLLPNTGPDGAQVMARRVGTEAAERGLVDLVGDPLEIAVGISTYPCPDLTRREELYGLAREAFLAARAGGGGVVVAAV